MYLSELMPINRERTDADPDGRTWYTIDPDTVYPFVLDRIAEALASEGGAPGITPSLLARARTVPAEAWQLAATDRELLAGDADLTARAQALDIVRLWALELQHAAIGHAPRGVRIVKRPSWRD